MTRLDTADLIVIAGRVLGIGTDAALARIDLAAAQAALNEAALNEAALGEAALGEAAKADAPRARSGREAAAGNCARLMHALLRHRPFARQAESIAVAAGLQYLSLNGWRADLDPPATAVVVVEALASGRLCPADAAAWLADRLSPRLSPRPAVRPGARELARLLPRPGRTLTRPHAFPGLTRVRALASLMLTVALGGLAMLAAACASGPATPAVRPATPAHATSARATPAHATPAHENPAYIRRQAPRPRPARAASRPTRLTYATCAPSSEAVRPSSSTATDPRDLPPAHRPCLSPKR